MENIVFDLGGVLLTWDASLLASRVFPKADSATIHQLAQFTKLPVWRELDRGNISLQQAISAHCKGNNMLEEYLRNMPHFIYQLVKGIDIMNRVQQAGKFKTFVLSNYNKEYLHVVKERFDWFEGFDGMVFSCDVGAVKPEKKIYQELIDRYDLDPEKTVFIDDKEENIEAAKKLGIHGILCDDHDHVVKELIRLNVLKDNDGLNCSILQNTPPPPPVFLLQKTQGLSNHYAPDDSLATTRRL
jgi:epoxide hydrolase-like predicted phosphatase